MQKNLFVHIPAQLLKSRLNFLLSRQLQPEVACQEVNIAKLDFDQLRACAAELADQGLATTLHAPFKGFDPGSAKPRLRKKAEQTCRLSLELAEALGAKRIVFHPGLPQGSNSNQQAEWLRNSLDFWPDYAAQAQQQKTIICLENIFESTPEPLFELLQGLDSAAFGHCFDIGHWNMFRSGTLNDWLNRMAPYLKHVHLHDNHGDSDEHLPIDQGQVCFADLFAWLKSSAKTPTMTLEAHNLQALESSLDAYSQLVNKSEPGIESGTGRPHHEV